MDITPKQMAANMFAVALIGGICAVGILMQYRIHKAICLPGDEMPVLPDWLVPLDNAMYAVSAMIPPEAVAIFMFILIPGMVVGGLAMLAMN